MTVRGHDRPWSEGEFLASVVVPAYDEEANLLFFLNEFESALQPDRSGIELILVNDGSRDRTRAVMERFAQGRPWVQVLGHPRNRGMGAAIRTGFHRARGEWLTFLPADGQIPPEAVIRLLAKAREDTPDLVLSVYRRRRDGLLRKVLSRGLRLTTWLVAGRYVATEGPYLLRKTRFRELHSSCETFFFNIEVALEAARLGWKLSWVELEVRPRRHGRSRVANSRKIAQILKELVRYRLTRRAK